MDDFTRPRINGAMLSSHQGRNVCLLGLAKDVDNSGSSFKLQLCDNKQVQVMMQQPLSEYVAGIVEVHGQVDQRNNILCHSYVLFPEETSKNFDFNLYNSAVELMARLPDHYTTGIPA